MGRKRTTDVHLPRRVYQRRGAYYFVDKAGKWHMLGKGYPEALTALAQRLAASAPIDTIEQVMARYEALRTQLDAARTQLSATEARLVKARKWMQHDKDKCLAREWRNINCTCGLQAFLGSLEGV